VDQVQPGAIVKAELAGEWYYAQTVIDSPHTIEWTTVGEQSLLTKIEWEIDEHLLVARRSYEWIRDGEGSGISGTGELGAPVAIYTIESHFDIRRDYNSVTGEEYNVIVENTTDRPWYEREYMRVDWSKNLVSEAEFLLLQRLYDGVTTEPAGYHVEDPSHPDAPRFERTGGELDYVEITNKTFVQPTTVDLDDGWGPTPTCWLYYQTHVDCAPAELTIRHSFLRVEENDYQPWDYSGDRMERFGYFVNERPGYDPDYGLVEPARSFFINRFDLWEESYRRENGERVACTSDADCDEANGSICDDSRVRGGQDRTPSCTLPYRERVVRPIAYHLSERFPEELVDDAAFVIADWNQAFVETIASLRENECLAAGGDAATCANERMRDATAFVMCHNPVAEGDHAVCGEIGTVARIGDLRYSLLAWVPDPGLGNPLGFGPSATDPETGEIIQATAFVYGASAEELATYGRDLVALLNGDLPPTEIVDGVNVERWLEGLQSRERSSMRTAHRHVVQVDGMDAHAIADEMGLDRIPRASRRTAPRPSSRGELVSGMRAVQRALSRGELLRPDDGQVQARMHALRDSPVEALLANPQMRFAAGVDPRLPLDDHTLGAASPLRGMSPARRQRFMEERRRMNGTVCRLRNEDFTDEGLLGLAQAIRDSVASGTPIEWYGRTYDLAAEGGGIDYEAVREMLLHPIFASTAAHEIGHTLGLRHNFSGSYDALNYHERYWELRNDGTMRPRAFDPLTPAEIEGRIREYQYSTVMDYGNNFLSTDAHGLGRYDVAAIKMGYGDLVEVFTDSPDAAEMAWVHFMQLFAYPVPIKSTSFVEGGTVSAWAYTELPDLAGGIDSLGARADVSYASLVPEESLAIEGIDTPLVDASGRPAVPYRFCSDEISDYYPECMLYDAGADQYETIQSIADTYWNYYVFTNFRRERLGFDVWPVYDRIYWNYFAKLLYANQDYVFNRIFLDELFAGDPTFADFETREDGLGAYTTGVGAAFSLLSRVVATPEPGPYVEYDRGDGTTGYYLDEFSDPEADVAFGDGRFLETTWNFDEGYYWFDQLERVGFYYDKVLALETLTDPQAYFIGQDEASDIRGFAISFHTTFPDATSGLFAGLLSDSWEVIGARPAAAGALRYPTIAELADGTAAGVPIDPSAGFSVQVSGAADAMLFIPASYDHTFLERSRIWVEGGAESIALPLGERVVFVDPFTSLRYTAASYPGDGGVETGVGARMLLHAQALADSGSLDELDDYLDVVNLMRTLTWHYGFGI
jgi:hypothetical protein